MDLPIHTAENNKLLAELTGKSKHKGFSVVYIFIHKNTAQKYTGSSNLLRRRMDYYFKGDFALVGKFLPLLIRSKLKGFKLIIFKLDSNKFSNQDGLILEQYYLLNKEFNLNTLKLVNPGSSKGDAVYVYDLTWNLVYYHAKSKIELKRVLKIHTETSKKFVDSKIPSLKQFLLLSYPIPTGLVTNISVEQLRCIMHKERLDMYLLGTRRKIPVVLEIKTENTFRCNQGDSLNFDSLTSCIKYLRELGLTIKRETRTKYIKNEKVFYNLLCKYSDKAFSSNLEKLGLIIDEYKKLKTDADALKVNRKNKPLLVKGENFEKEFEKIMDTIKYFDSLSIKLDRKTLNICLKHGKIYKDYIFAF